MLRRKNAIPAVFADVTFARDIPAEELTTLDRLSTPTRFATGRDLTVQGTPGREVIVVLAGAAEVVRDGRTVAEVGSGQVIGELSLLTGEHRNATVTATTDVRAAVLNRREFATLLDSCPVLSHEIFSAAVERLAAA